MAAPDPNSAVSPPFADAPGSGRLGLYVHVPFCRSICNYCNFNRGLFDRDLKERYVAALHREIGAAGDLEEQSPTMAADTLYFGGGTPSLLAPEEIAAIVDESRRAFGLTPDAEVTLEANPETVHRRQLALFREAGVNRLSFGVQSFRDSELARLGREHSAGAAIAAVGAARAAGFSNISIDLMMWLPGQTVQEWLTSVDAAVSLGPEHISLYILEVYPHLPLQQEIVRHGWTQADDDAAAEMYEQSMARLASSGYTQYEISNVCRQGFESRHNLKYWSDGEWLGFGPGAHSTRGGVRWRNVPATDDYIARISNGVPAAVDRRRLSPDQRLGDAVFTGLRLSRGVDLDIMYLRYGVDIWRRFGDRLQPFVDAGLLLHENKHLRLTRQGMLLANEVMSVFV